MDAGHSTGEQVMDQVVKLIPLEYYFFYYVETSHPTYTGFQAGAIQLKYKYWVFLNFLLAYEMLLTFLMERR